MAAPHISVCTAEAEKLCHSTGKICSTITEGFMAGQAGIIITAGAVHGRLLWDLWQAGSALIDADQQVHLQLGRLLTWLDHSSEAMSCAARSAAAI